MWPFRTDPEEELKGLVAKREALVNVIKSVGNMSIWDKQQLMELSAEIARLEHRVSKGAK